METSMDIDDEIQQLTCPLFIKRGLHWSAVSLHLVFRFKVELHCLIY